MKLIGSGTSPFVRKVRVVLAEKRIECRYERENEWAADITIGRWNPLGKVPALLTDDGAAIFDSRVIVEYLDALTPVHRLIPPGDRARVEVRCREALADGLLEAAVLARLENARPDLAQRSPHWIARQRGKIDAALQAMADGLAEQPFCCEGKYSLADVAVGCSLGYLDLRYPDIDWRGTHPRLARLAGTLFARPSFRDTAPPAA